MLVAKEQPVPTVMAFITSTNEMIDLDAKRLAAIEDQVPETIWALLTFVSILAVVITGYVSGLGARRHPFALVAIPVVLAVVVGILLDLDRPRRGLIQVSQDSLLRLQRDLAAGAASSSSP